MTFEYLESMQVVLLELHIVLLHSIQMHITKLLYTTMPTKNVLNIVLEGMCLNWRLAQDIHVRIPSMLGYQVTAVKAALGNLLKSPYAAIRVLQE